MADISYLSPALKTLLMSSGLCSPSQQTDTHKAIRGKHE